MECRIGEKCALSRPRRKRVIFKRLAPRHIEGVPEPPLPKQHSGALQLPKSGRSILSLARKGQCPLACRVMPQLRTLSELFHCSTDPRDPAVRRCSS